MRAWGREHSSRESNDSEEQKKDPGFEGEYGSVSEDEFRDQVGQA